VTEVRQGETYIYINPAFAKKVAQIFINNNRT